VNAVPDLRKTIEDLAEDFARGVADEVATAIHGRAREFAEGVLEAIRGSSLTDITSSALAHTPVRVERRVVRDSRGRRSSTDIAELMDEIEALCRKHDGIRAESLQATLKISNKEFFMPMKKLLAARRVTKTGQKRSTLYFVVGRPTRALAIAGT
jgi:hypothetical protein